MPPMVLVASTQTDPGQHCSLWTHGLLEQVSEPAASTASRSRLRRALEEDPPFPEEDPPEEEDEEDPPLLLLPPDPPETTTADDPGETYCKK